MDHRFHTAQESTVTLENRVPDQALGRWLPRSRASAAWGSVICRGRRGHKADTTGGAGPPWETRSSDAEVGRWTQGNVAAVGSFPSPGRRKLEAAQMRQRMDPGYTLSAPSSPALILQIPKMPRRKRAPAGRGQDLTRGPEDPEWPQLCHLPGPHTFLGAPFPSGERGRGRGGRELNGAQVHSCPFGHLSLELPGGHLFHFTGKKQLAELTQPSSWASKLLGTPPLPRPILPKAPAP